MRKAAVISITEKGRELSLRIAQNAGFMSSERFCFQKHPDSGSRSFGSLAGLVSDIFTHPKTDVAKELIRKDIGNEAEVEKTAAMQEIQSGEIIRIVFSDNSAFEPVIANLILTFHEPVNILRANTRNVGGVAKGEMVLQFMEYSQNTEAMKHYLEECGLAVEEAPEYAH